jgi:hypothetical protein
MTKLGRRLHPPHDCRVPAARRFPPPWTIEEHRLMAGDSIEAL